MTVGIEWLSVQRGFTVLDNAMITLKRHFMKFMLMLVVSLPFIPTEGPPAATAARAYSIWTSFPEGLEIIGGRINW